MKRRVINHRREEKEERDQNRRKIEKTQTSKMLQDMRAPASEWTVSTVNSNIFARTLFSRNFAYAKFRENKTLAKWQKHSVVY